MERVAVAEGWGDHDSVRVHYLDARADATGTAVVIVPGFGEEAADHHDLLAALAPRRALAVDLRGRGSSSDGGRYRVEDHVGDLDAALTAAGVGQLHLVTYSRGTTYGLAWALGHLDRIESITIGDYPAAQIVPPTAMVDTAARRIWRGRPMGDRMPRAAIEKMVADAVAIDFWSELSHLTAPMMLIRGGAAGAMVTDAVLERYRRTVAHLRVVTFEQSSHDLWSPDPRRFETTVAAFLDDIDPQLEG